MFWTPNLWISRSPDLQISGFPGPQISKFPDSQISRIPDFQTTPPAPAPAPPDEFSDPNLTPLPTHPGIKYVARALAAIFQRSDIRCVCKVIRCKAWKWCLLRIKLEQHCSHSSLNFINKSSKGIGVIKYCPFTT